MAGAAALAEVGYWRLELLLYEVGAPCGRGLTFFCLATSSRREVNVRRTARGVRPQAESKKVSKEKAMTASVGYMTGRKRSGIR